jgi:hypothetical protein
MKRANAFLPATALFVILAGCNAGNSGTAVADKEAVPADGVDFKLVANKGDVHKYKMTMSMDGKGPAGGPGPTEINVKLDLNQEMKFTEVKDGNYTIEIKSADVKATGTAPFADMIGEQMKTTVSKMTVDEKGRVIKQEGAPDSAMGTGGTLFFPDKKVKVGDTWERTMPGQNGQSMVVKYKFEGTESADGKTLAKISMTPKAPEGVKMDGKFDYLVDMDNAVVMQGKGKMTTSAQGGSMVVSIDMTKI